MEKKNKDINEVIITERDNEFYRLREIAKKQRPNLNIDDLLTTDELFDLLRCAILYKIKELEEI